MPPTGEAALLRRFRETITARVGLTFDDGRSGELRSLLAERAQGCGLSEDAYIEQLSLTQIEFPELARRLTVPETYFFRNPDQLEACMERAVPECRTGRGGRGLRILSAACASGEEPYSLAILLRERWPALAPSSSIVAVDLNPTILDRARRARYTAWSLRETSPDIKARYFRSDGAEFVLDPSIRDAVSFEVMNLVEPSPGQLTDESFDIVFCRNVLMYFSPEHFAATVSRLARALVPGGFFFLGHAETLRGVSQDFHLRHTGDAFYYQRKVGRLRRTGQPPLRASLPPHPSVRPTGSASRRPEAVEAADTAGTVETAWVESIAQSRDRMEALRAPPLPTFPAIQSNERPGHVASAALLDLLHKEQFGAALSMMQRDHIADDDVDRVLMQAVVSAHAGQFEEARALCRLILDGDELNAGAQYVLALCHEHEGDSSRAIYHNQLSAYLDPGFAMPRVHMGLLYSRIGDTEAARRELGEARRLLEREDAARLLLFGGGFGRPALLALCDAELSKSAGGGR